MTVNVKFITVIYQRITVSESLPSQFVPPTSAKDPCPTKEDTNMMMMMTFE